MLAPKELRQIHPLGKSPVITDNGNTIAESGAIIEYIIDTYGEGRLIPPPKTPERLRYTYWLHFAEGSAMSPLLQKLVFTLLPKRSPCVDAPSREYDFKAGADHHGRSAGQAANGFLGRRACENRMVRRIHVHGGGYSDELPGRGGVLPRPVSATAIPS